MENHEDAKQFQRKVIQNISTKLIQVNKGETWKMEQRQHSKPTNDGKK